MKVETAILFEKHHTNKRLQFVSTELGLELDYDLTDEEKMELVQLEYGKTIVGKVDELFIKIMKDVIKLAQERAKFELRDRLSEL